MAINGVPPAANATFHIEVHCKYAWTQYRCIHNNSNNNNHLYDDPNSNSMLNTTFKHLKLIILAIITWYGYNAHLIRYWIYHYNDDMTFNEPIRDWTNTITVIILSTGFCAKKKKNEITTKILRLNQQYTYICELVFLQFHHWFEWEINIYTHLLVDPYPWSVR